MSEAGPANTSTASYAMEILGYFGATLQLGLLRSHARKSGQVRTVR